jgi:hypothetical protein
LAGLAETGEPLRGPFNSFAEYAAEPIPEDQEERRRLVRAQRRSAIGCLRRHLDKRDRDIKSKPIPGPHLVYGFLTSDAGDLDDG